MLCLCRFKLMFVRICMPPPLQACSCFLYLSFSLSLSFIPDTLLTETLSQLCCVVSLH